VIPQPTQPALRALEWVNRCDPRKTAASRPTGSYSATTFGSAT
jgi:hypothetical protein